MAKQKQNPSTAKVNADTARIDTLKEIYAQHRGAY